jgi:hypothetical protein
MTAAVVALLAGAAPERELAAGFEEEGVPLAVERTAGEALALAREAAGRSQLGLGIGGSPERLVVVLAAAPGRPYLEAAPSEARQLGHAAARIVARRPLGAGKWGGVGASPAPPLADGLP